MSEPGLRFGPFRLVPARRLLLENDQPVQLGSRALDLLIHLAQRAGEVVAKDELLRAVWQRVEVDETSLRVQIATLRRALHDDGGEHRYIVNIPLRGYSFVAPIDAASGDAARPAAPHEPTPSPDATSPARTIGLPVLMTRVIGREDAIRTLVQSLAQRRFVTLVGAGGIGKTTAMIAAAQEVAPRFAEGVRFVDLAALSDSQHVDGALAGVLGVAARGGQTRQGLLEHLARRHLLIVLDNCEHLLQATATLAEDVLGHAPRVHVATTSREPLFAQGEWVLRLPSLALPPAGASMSAAQALQYPAVQLFIERCAAGSGGFELRDDDVPTVIALCRGLDGIPLAIELAAARVDQLGLHGLARHLGGLIGVLTQGRRTALPRHRTLEATLDWSHALLDDTQRQMLGRLSLFAGAFALSSALRIAPDGVDAAAARDAIADLAAKSLLAVDVTGDPVQYRLLETTRAYASRKLRASGDFEAASRAHARHLCELFDEASVAWQTLGTAQWRHLYARRIDDVRAAIDWAFASEHDSHLGVELTCASAPVWFELSQMDEYRRRAEAALSRGARAFDRHPQLELRLRLTLGHALWHTCGPGVEMAQAFSRSLALAQSLGSAQQELQSLWGLWTERNVYGDYAAALEYARRYGQVSSLLPDDTHSHVVADRMMALSLHFTGDQIAAQRHSERVFAQLRVGAEPARIQPFQLDARAGTCAVLARILWLRGFPDKAMRVALEGIESAQRTKHALSLCFALYGAAMVALWVGDRDTAAGHAQALLQAAQSNSLVFWEAWARTYMAALADAPGWFNPVCGAQQLEVMGTFSPSQMHEAALARARQGLANWCAAELLRAQGERVLECAGADARREAEQCFRHALDLAATQGALAWELRAATSLAQLWIEEGRRAQARELLARVHARYTEGLRSADLLRAQAVIDSAR
ncbi:MAG TPA: winged helix-turn-helix domain-containing protein [Burkholderiaceae bacterium]|nr:winged helix-turn-helix domain-containing protein [Burkholderiaceae bacterium]